MLLKYSLLNALAGLIIILFLFRFQLHGDHFILALWILSAIIASFISSLLFWKLIIRDKENPNRIKIIITGLFTGIFSHFIFWVLWFAGIEIRIFAKGKYIYTSWIHEAKDVLMKGILSSCIGSLPIFGWITVSFSIAIGFLLINLERRKAINFL